GASPPPTLAGRHFLCPFLSNSRAKGFMVPPVGTSDTFETATFSGENLACRRGGRMVFAGLSFNVPAGAAVVLRGPNGSGKTTLLRLMAGLARPVAGKLLWSGAPIDDPESHGAHLR